MHRRGHHQQRPHNPFSRSSSGGRRSMSYSGDPRYGPQQTKYKRTGLGNSPDNFQLGVRACLVVFVLLVVIIWSSWSPTESPPLPGAPKSDAPEVKEATNKKGTTPTASPTAAHSATPVPTKELGGRLQKTMKETDPEESAARKKKDEGEEEEETVPDYEEHHFMPFDPEEDETETDVEKVEYEGSSGSNKMQQLAERLQKLEDNEKLEAKDKQPKPREKAVGENQELETGNKDQTENDSSHDDIDDALPKLPEEEEEENNESGHSAKVKRGTDSDEEPTSSPTAGPTEESVVTTSKSVSQGGADGTVPKPPEEEEEENNESGHSAKVKRRTDNGEEPTASPTAGPTEESVATTSKSVAQGGADDTVPKLPEEEEEENNESGHSAKVKRGTDNGEEPTSSPTAGPTEESVVTTSKLENAFLRGKKPQEKPVNDANENHNGKHGGLRRSSSTKDYDPSDPTQASVEKSETSLLDEQNSLTHAGNNILLESEVESQSGTPFKKLTSVGKPNRSSTTNGTLATQKNSVLLANTPEAELEQQTVSTFNNTAPNRQKGESNPLTLSSNSLNFNSFGNTGGNKGLTDAAKPTEETKLPGAAAMFQDIISQNIASKESGVINSSIEDTKYDERVPATEGFSKVSSSSPSNETQQTLPRGTLEFPTSQGNGTGSIVPLNFAHDTQFNTSSVFNDTNTTREEEAYKELAELSKSSNHSLPNFSELFPKGEGANVSNASSTWKVNEPLGASLTNNSIHKDNPPVEQTAVNAGTNLSEAVDVERLDASGVSVENGSNEETGIDGVKNTQEVDYRYRMRKENEGDGKLETDRNTSDSEVRKKDLKKDLKKVTTTKNVEASNSLPGKDETSTFSSTPNSSKTEEKTTKATRDRRDTKVESPTKELEPPSLKEKELRDGKENKRKDKKDKGDMNIEKENDKDEKKEEDKDAAAETTTGEEEENVEEEKPEGEPEETVEEEKEEVKHKKEEAEQKEEEGEEEKGSEKESEQKEGGEKGKQEEEEGEEEEVTTEEEEEEEVTTEGEEGEKKEGEEIEEEEVEWKDEEWEEEKSGKKMHVKKTVPKASKQVRKRVTSHMEVYRLSKAETTKTSEKKSHVGKEASASLKGRNKHGTKPEHEHKHHDHGHHPHDKAKSHHSSHGGGDSTTKTKPHTTKSTKTKKVASSRR